MIQIPGTWTAHKARMVHFCINKKCQINEGDTYWKLMFNKAGIAYKYCEKCHAEKEEIIKQLNDSLRTA